MDSILFRIFRVGKSELSKIEKEIDDIQLEFFTKKEKQIEILLENNKALLKNIEQSISRIEEIQ